MYAFIDAQRGAYGVEPICRVLEIAPSGYYTYRARQGDPTRRPARAQRDDVLRVEVERVWDDNRRVYGVRKVWHQLRRWFFERTALLRASIDVLPTGKPLLLRVTRASSGYLRLAAASGSVAST